VTEQRVVIVGGGVLGTMHAVMARRRGFSVVHLEREPEARGASVRNFGLIWVSGRRAGPELALALRARELWEEIAASAPGTGFRPAGSLTLATCEAELRVLGEAAELPDAKQRDFELLDPDGVRAVNPALRGEFLGGLYCRTDAIVEPRVALPALRSMLAGAALAGAALAGAALAGAALAGPGYEWLPGREAVEVVAHGVRDQRGRWHCGDLVVLCTGANFTGVAGPHLAATAHHLRRVRLQMMQTAPFPESLTTSVADGDSLRYYPAYEVPSLALLGPQTRVAAASRAQLLFVQRADGGLTVGDTHSYDEPFAFDVDEEPYDHLRARAEALLGRPLPRVLRRWAGVYSEVTGTSDLYHRSVVAPGVVLVTGPGGRGMTCSPAIAEETFLP
jgi:FAD dependent oxidoreductase TIGR03364